MRRRWVALALLAALAGCGGGSSSSDSGSNGGSIDEDFKNVDLDAKDKQSTPYYVTVRIAAADKEVPVKDDPDIRFDGIDDRGQEQGSVTSPAAARSRRFTGPARTSTTATRWSGSSPLPAHLPS
jgi:hypothetical protein